MKVTPEERELAWIGDAVLSLFARQWILKQGKGMDQAQLEAMTSNQFLSCIGNPTCVEAEIGKAFLAGGMAAAEEHIDREIVPLFRKQRKRRG